MTKAILPYRCFIDPESPLLKSRQGVPGCVIAGESSDGTGRALMPTGRHSEPGWGTPRTGGPIRFYWVFWPSAPKTPPDACIGIDPGTTHDGLCRSRRLLGYTPGNDRPAS